MTDEEDKQNYNVRPELLEDDLKLSCCVLMLDVTSKQVHTSYNLFIFPKNILLINTNFRWNYMALSDIQDSQVQ